MNLAVDARDIVFVTRQPILDAAGKVFAYELLYRDAGEVAAGEDAGETSGARGLTDAVITFGLDTVAEGRPAFLNLTKDLLVRQAGTLLPAAKVILQIRADVVVDDEVVDACRILSEKGYRLALDEYVPGSPAQRLVPFVRFVKVNMTAAGSVTAADIIKQCAPDVKPIATSVETAESFAAAQKGGFKLFQGYYFCKPVTCKSGALPARRLAYLQLLAALRQPNVGVREIEELVKHDMSLSVRVLRCVNSAAYGLRSEVTSIRQALVMIGLDPIRKWVSVWSVAGLNTGGTSELVTVSLLRARCCELLGQRLPGRSGDSELFLLGLCSLLDAIIDRPLADAIADLPLGAEIKSALLGEQNTARAVLDTVIAYENGSWDEALAGAETLGLPKDAPAAAYGEALQWARELSRAAA
jgi:c-di-GMP-related signal transduction protein